MSTKQISAVSAAVIVVSIAIAGTAPIYSNYDRWDLISLRPKTLLSRHLDATVRETDTNSPVSENNGVTFALSSNMVATLPNLLDGNPNEPMHLLLDTMGGCTWLPTEHMMCVNTSTTTTEPHPCAPKWTVKIDPNKSNTSITTQPPEKAACSHYAAGWVSGSLHHPPLHLANISLSAPSSLSSSSQPILMVDEFYSTAPFSYFQTFYGGAGGVLGLLPYDFLLSSEDPREILPGVVPGLLSGLFRQAGENSNDAGGKSTLRPIICISLPRENEGSGKFSLGGPSTLFDNSSSSASSLDRIILPMPRDDAGEPDLAMKRLLFSLDDIGIGHPNPQALSQPSSSHTNATTKTTETQKNTTTPIVTYTGRHHLDTALNVIYTSPSLSHTISTLFSPPATLDNDTNLHTIPCNATAPEEIYIIIGTADASVEGEGQGWIKIPILAHDMIVRVPDEAGTGVGMGMGKGRGKGKGEGICISAFQFGGPNGEWRRLGWPFWRNVHVGFDLEGWRVGIQARARGADGSSGENAGAGAGAVAVAGRLAGVGSQVVNSQAGENGSGHGTTTTKPSSIHRGPGFSTITPGWNDTTSSPTLSPTSVSPASATLNLDIDTDADTDAHTKVIPIEAKVETDTHTKVIPIELFIPATSALAELPLTLAISSAFSSTSSSRSHRAGADAETDEDTNTDKEKLALTFPMSSSPPQHAPETASFTTAAATRTGTGTGPETAMTTPSYFAGKNIANQPDFLPSPTPASLATPLPPTPVVVGVVSTV